MSTGRLLAVAQGMNDVVSTTWGEPDFVLCCVGILQLRIPAMKVTSYSN